MATIVCDAVQIETNDGTGKLVSATDASLGLASGVFYLITGRPGLTGAKTVAGDTTRTIWYEDILAEESDFRCARAADFVEVGGMASFSSLSFSIVNVSAFFSAVEALGINLARCRVTYFHVESSDDSTYTFTRRWTGIVDETPFNELTYQVQCVDNFKSFFRSVPAFSSGDALGESDEEIEEQMIPVAVGRVPYGNLTPVIQGGARVEINFNSGREFYVTAASAYDSTFKYLTLYVNGHQFVQDDFRIVGKYVRVLAGGVDQSVKIISNYALTPGFIILVLEDFLDVSTAFVTWTGGSTATDIWYFDIVAFNAKLLASNKPIYQYIENPNGKPYLFRASEDSKKLVDVSVLRNNYSTSNIDNTGFPGFDVISSSVVGDSIRASYAIVPSLVTFYSQVAGSTITGVSSSLNDVDDDTYITFTATIAATQTTGFTYKFDLPEDMAEMDFDSLFLLLDLSHKGSAALSTNVRVSVLVEDVLGRATGELITEYLIYSDTIGTSFSDLFLLPGFYFDTERTDSNYYAHKSSLDISSLLDSTKKTSSYVRARLEIEIRNNHASTSQNYEMRLKEVGFVGVSTVSLRSDPLYTAMKGETFGTTWNARRTAANPILLAGDTMEHLVRNYSYNYPVWRASTAYSLNQIVRSTADNAHFYICTTAGTSAASEPTFPTSSGATVADGTVVWTELGTFKINESAFDDLVSSRGNWFVGRSIVEKKSIEDLLIDLARHTFLGLTTDSQGRITPKPWLDEQTAILTFSESNIIAGTLSEISLTPIRRVYNDILVRYGWNPALGDFAKQIQITNVEQPAFPEENELTGTSTSLGSFTIEKLMVGQTLFKITTGSAHGLSTGDVTSLTGNTVSPLSFNYSGRQVSVASSTIFYVDGHDTSAVSSTAGTLTLDTNVTNRWKTFVSGIRDYATARTMWEQARASYLLTKVVNKLPTELGDCPFFIDPFATDPAGVTLFTELGYAADYHPAALYARALLDWTAWQKKQVTFEVAKSSANLALNLYDPVNFTDQKLTGGGTLLGWIQEIVDIPGDGEKPPRLKIGLTLMPEDLELCDTIFDVVGAADTITDTVGATDSITDTPC